MTEWVSRVFERDTDKAALKGPFVLRQLWVVGLLRFLKVKTADRNELLYLIIYIYTALVNKLFRRKKKPSRSQ